MIVPVSEVLYSKHPEPRTPDYFSLRHTAWTCWYWHHARNCDKNSPSTQRRCRSMVQTLKHHVCWNLEPRPECYAKWLANDTPPWAAYRALMVGCLIALDKIPGISLIAIDEVLRQLIAKCVLRVDKVEAQEACGKLISSAEDCK